MAIMESFYLSIPHIQSTLGDELQDRGTGDRAPLGRAPATDL
jgi:hypothetical protein